MTTKNFVVKNGLTTGNIILDASSSRITANLVVANLSVPSSANLGSVSNVIITGGTSGQVLTTDGFGVLSWQTVSSGGGGGGTGSTSNVAFTYDVFTGNGVQTNFTLSSNAAVSNVLVNYNGALQLTDAYTISGNVISMTEAPANGSKIEVMVLSGPTTPSGTTTQIQFNDNGLFGGSSSFTYDKSTNVLHFANASVSGNIIPTSNNAFSLGTADHVWRDVFIGPGSLYVDGQKVLQSNANSIIFSADINQTLRMTTSGTGDIEMLPAGTGSIAVKGPLQIQAGKTVLSSDGSAVVFATGVATDSIVSRSVNTDMVLSANGTGRVKVDDDLVITGNIEIQGVLGNLSVTTLSVQDNIIDISSETTGTPSNNAGIRVVRGDQPATQLRWLESGSSGKWQITSDGTAYLDLVGKDSSGNISLGNVATANYFSGDGSLLSSVTGSNVTGQVGNALIAGTVYTNAQPNITSVGTLTGLTASGTINMTSASNISLGAVGNIHITGGTNGQVLTTNGSGNVSWAPPVMDQTAFLSPFLLMGA